MTGKGRIGRDLEGKCRKFILIPLGYILVETEGKEKIFYALYRMPRLRFKLNTSH